MRPSRRYSPATTPTTASPRNIRPQIRAPLRHPRAETFRRADNKPQRSRHATHAAPTGGDRVQSAAHPMMGPSGERMPMQIVDQEPFDPQHVSEQTMAVRGFDRLLTTQRPAV